MGDRRLEGGGTRGTVFGTCKFLTTSDQFLSMLYVSCSQLQLFNILPVVVGWLLTLMTSVVVDFVVVVVTFTASTCTVVVVGITASTCTVVVVDFTVSTCTVVVVDFTASTCTVVVKEESVPVLHNSRGL